MKVTRFIFSFVSLGLLFIAATACATSPKTNQTNQVLVLPDYPMSFAQVKNVAQPSGLETAGDATKTTTAANFVEGNWRYHVQFEYKSMGWNIIAYKAVRVNTPKLKPVARQVPTTARSATPAPNNLEHKPPPSPGDMPPPSGSGTAGQSVTIVYDPYPGTCYNVKTKWAWVPTQVVNGQVVGGHWMLESYQASYAC